MSFLEIAALIVLSAVVYGIMTVYVMHVFFKKLALTQTDMVQQMFADDEELPGIDEAFRTSPIGIPPSLARD